MIDRIYNQDNVRGLQQLPADCIDLTVTSQPYDNLRAYNGFTWDFEALARELYRVTKPGGVVVWVVGDATVKGSETGTSFKQALFFMECGFNLHDTMIYQKETPTWNITSKRYRQHVEYMFVFSKGKVKTFNPIEDMKVKNMTPRKCKSNRNGNPHYEMYVPKKEYTCRGNIWRYPVGSSSAAEKIAFSHPAIFPEQLAQDHILSWSNPGDLVLDPFMGSGTTAKMAAANGRHYIGFEISEEYCEIARQRLLEAQQGNLAEAGAGQ
jgi:site-specific DNA-methyltransferase (adenine-specific)